MTDCETCTEEFWCDDCEDLQLMSNPDFIAAMTYLIETIETTDFDISEVQVTSDLFGTVT